MTARPTVVGKSIQLGGRKLTIKGVTYGPFSSGPGGGFDRPTAERDLAQIAEAGINAIRVYTPPERWMLDLADAHELLVMIGIPWQQHIAFLDPAAPGGIEEKVREVVASCAGHPAVLCYAIGNEIPASIVRWHGRARIERFLARLCDAARHEDPGALLTYVNFPSTEYLRLPDIDFHSFNVYLERRELLESYLARLQNLADDRPLILAELGLDSRRNGEAQQAGSLEWQLEACSRAGCAGMFVFAWSDQWHRGGHEILDWDFGLTTRAREPKPALVAVQSTFASIPPENTDGCPSISVVICTYNGSATLRACLAGVLGLRYPDYEVIVVSDGSTDGSARIAAEHQRVRVIETTQQGLAAARNTGMRAATGEIVAYIDDDAIPDEDWLTHLAATFRSGEYAAVGGPNILPARSGRMAECVANAPGGPTHVLVSDREAEHIPGCNMAISRSALQEIGGFDPQFRAAGDDVDVCWRLRDAGKRIGFSPGAVVHHHRRSSVRGYLRQQRGYGKAEALLERKHPDKYTAAGHVHWSGRLYGNGAAQHRGGWRWRVYYGAWGTASYQSLYGPRGGLLESLPLMPEWYLAIALLAALSAAGTAWTPLLLAVPLLVLALFALLIDATLGARRARFSSRTRTWRLRLLTASLYLLQPLARLQGRITHGLTPWRLRPRRMPASPLPRSRWFWSEQWQDAEQRVRAIVEALRADGAAIRSGGDWDRWDLEARGGLLGVARLRLAIEEHGAGRQVVRVRWWPHVRRGAAAFSALLAAVAALAIVSGGEGVALSLGALAAAVAVRLIYECGVAIATMRSAVLGTQATAIAADREDDAPLAHPAALSQPGPVPAPCGRGARDAA
jgi:GT2 family glycosyltransferase